MLLQAVLRLKKHKDSTIRWPRETELAGLAKLVRKRSPLTKNVVGFIDRLSIPVKCPSDRFVQDAYYNSHIHETAVNNVIFFGADGKVKYAAINYPGCMEDEEVARPLAGQAMSHLGDYAICVDEGFTGSGELYETFVGPLSAHAIDKLTHNPQLRRLVLARHHRYASLRLAAEWGIRGLLGTFARLKSKLTSQKRKRHDIILEISLLHNFRTEHVGFNKIQAVFSRHYMRVVNTKHYDRIERYFANDLMLI